MVVGLLTLDLHFPEAHSLKGKRSLLRPMIETMRRNWNVSVAEIDHHDTWQRAAVAVASVNTSAAHAHQTLEAVARHVGELDSSHLLDYSIQIL